MKEDEACGGLPGQEATRCQDRLVGVEHGSFPLFHRTPLSPLKGEKPVLKIKQISSV